MVYGTIGFGDALLLMPLLTPIIGVRNAVVLVNLWGILTALLNFITHREYLDKGYFFRFLLLGVPATIVSTFLVIVISLEIIELTLGIFIVGYSCLKLFYMRKNQTEMEVMRDLNSDSPIIYLGGCVYGFLAGLISAVGPINVALLEKTKHYRESLIENFAAVGTVLSLSRIPFYFIGQIFPYDLTLAFLLAFPIIYLGTKVGQRLTSKIPVKTFQVIILCILIGLGLRSIITAILNLVIFP